MFTGIVEEVGTVRRVHSGPASAVLTIQARTVLEDLKIGDSVAVNGICLTVTTLPAGAFTADVMHETLNRSSFSGLRPGSPVNLERALPAGGRFGGHIVSGHVDGVGTLTRVKQDGPAVWYTVRTSPEIRRQLVEKGSVAIDGISLTVAAVHPDGFSVSVIPHTLRATVLGRRQEGDLVNLETDILGKYVEALLRPAVEPDRGTLTREFLTRCGY